MNLVDQLGLSQQDVAKIVNQAQTSTNIMTQNGERIDGGYANNILSTLQDVRDLLLRPRHGRQPYLGCHDQASRVKDAEDNLNAMHPFDDRWAFKVIPVNDGMHYVVIGYSENPGDPNLILDPWNKTFVKTTHGYVPPLY